MKVLSKHIFKANDAALAKIQDNFGRHKLPFYPLYGVQGIQGNLENHFLFDIMGTWGQSLFVTYKEGPPLTTE